RKRLRRRVPLARHVAFLDRSFFDPPDGMAGHPVEDVEDALLGRLRDRLDRTAAHVDVGEDRGRGDVMVPQGVVYELKMPLPLARLQIDADQALGEQVV